MHKEIPRKTRTAAAALWLLSLCLLAGGCIYRIDIQQGNLLDEDSIDQVQVGMTRSQVRFLLGTPTVQDAFHDERWDYPYYLRRGRSKEVEKHWLIVYFDGDRVARLDKNVELHPSS